MRHQEGEDGETGVRTGVVPKSLPLSSLRTKGKMQFCYSLDTNCRINLVVLDRRQGERGQIVMVFTKQANEVGSGSIENGK